MRITTPRRVGALLVSVALVTVTTAFAGAAGAADDGRWWYGDLSVAKANRVTTGSGVTVAVLDSGVKASLPDLAGRVLPGTSFFGARSDGRTDTPSQTASYFGHGTAMAGFIAGTGRGAGMRGVAPGAKILPVVVGQSEAASDEALGQGIVWAADHGAKVINVSIAGPHACTAQVQQAVDHAVRKDVIIVAATGNTPGIAVGSPANCIGTIGVGGQADARMLAGWDGGTTGPELDFVAPAQNLSSLLLDNTISAPDLAGTSNATALTSGIFALLRAKYPAESARQIVTRALYNVANGLGGKVFAKRVNDTLGYGEILPSFALTDAPPASAQNPIYDTIDAHLRSSGSTSGSASGSASTSTPPPGGTSPEAAPGSTTDSGGVSPALIAVIVVAVLVVVALVAVLLTRNRRSRPPAAGRS